MGRARPRFGIARWAATRAGWLALLVALAWPVSTGAQTTAPADREMLLRLLRQLPAQPGTGQRALDRFGTALETGPAEAAVEAAGAPIAVAVSGAPWWPLAQRHATHRSTR